MKLSNIHTFLTSFLNGGLKEIVNSLYKQYLYTRYFCECCMINNKIINKLFSLAVNKLFFLLNIIHF